MEVQVGEWYLCEDFIDEPVQVRTVEAGRIEVAYLCSGKLKWLGYPKIWRACRPHAIGSQVSYDAGTRVITLASADGTAQQYTLAQLRASLLPESVKPKFLASGKTARTAVAGSRRQRSSAESALDWMDADIWDDSDNESEEDYETESED